MWLVIRFRAITSFFPWSAVEITEIITKSLCIVLVHSCIRSSPGLPVGFSFSSTAGIVLVNFSACTDMYISVGKAQCHDFVYYLLNTKTVTSQNVMTISITMLR